MLVSLWDRGNTYFLWVVLQTAVASTEPSMKVPQKYRNRFEHEPDATYARSDGLCCDGYLFFF